MPIFSLIQRRPTMWLRVLVIVALLPSLLLVAGCGRARSDEPLQTQPAEAEPAGAVPEVKKNQKKWALAIHGGAGAITDDGTDRESYYTSLSSALTEGGRRLEAGEAALDVVEAVVTMLEDDPLFNAGRGAVFNNRGVHELDAAIMDGRSLACGSVAGLRNIRNPIALARQVMQNSQHVFLAGDGADEFARSVSARRAPQNYFTTQARFDQWQEARRQERAKRRPGGNSSGSSSETSGFGTVGAVVLDRYGNLAAGTSTGGLTNKRFGRIGDVPVIGAGTYANNQTAAVSCTGKGEEFIRHTVAFDVTARMKYRGETLQQAADALVNDTLSPGQGGLIAIDASGEIAMPFNTSGMYRGAIDSDGLFVTGVFDQLRASTAANGP